VESSLKILNDLLKKHDLEYDEFIINLQKGAQI